MAFAPLRQRSALAVTAAATVTWAAAATRTAAATRMATATRTATVTRTAAATRMATVTRTATITRAAAATATAVSAVTATAALAFAAPAPQAPAPPAPAVPASALAVPAPDPPVPSCGTASDAGFPIGTRIHGGPDEYPAGGAVQGWKLDLTNTTDASCTGIHPVLVLADRGRSLRPGQIRLEFYDEGSDRWRPVVFEATEEAESVGVFADFGGFAVPAGRTVTVPVRLAFREDTAPDEVVVNAAVVQRRGADGDWIGASGDYRLTVGPAEPDGFATPEVPGQAADPTTPTPREPKGPTGPKVPKEPKDPRAPRGSGSGTDTDPPGHELAHTGRESDRESDRDVLLLAPVAAALVLLGALLVRTARRRHR
ncbi:hypothetical protein OG361_14795 [Streptomyces sp. NBC_00090]|uniref:hypothetical protein n=1 Tax=Streptomyces sp. NBC_00090 TaxID=2903619 RepID=UPI003246D687